MNTQDNQKVCKTCNKIKNLNDFEALRHECKQCRYEYKKPTRKCLACLEYKSFTEFDKNKKQCKLCLELDIKHCKYCQRIVNRTEIRGLTCRECALKFQRMSYKKSIKNNLRQCSYCKEFKKNQLFSTYNDEIDKIAYTRLCKSCKETIKSLEQLGQRKCNKCNLIQPIKNFNSKTSKGKRIYKICRNCANEWARNKYSCEFRLLAGAKIRAKKYNLEFNIDESDIIIPKYCPVLGIKLERAKGRMNNNSPSLDRINNNRGYIKGNVCVISWRANFLKRDGTSEEFEKIAKYIKNNEV